MEAASLGIGCQFLVVDDEQEVCWCDFIVEGGADEESDVDLEWKCADEFGAWHVFTVYRHLQGLVSEDVDADVGIDGVGNGFGSAWHEKGKLGLEGVLEVGVGDVLGLDLRDASVDVLGGEDVNGFGHEDGAAMVASGGRADASVEDDGHTFVLSVGVVGFYLARRGGLEGHTLRLLAHDGTAERVRVDDDFARFLADLLEVDDQREVVIAHELVVESIPPLAGVSDLNVGRHVARKDNVLRQILNDEPIGQCDLRVLLNGLQEPENGGQAEKQQEHRKIAINLDQSQSSEYHFDKISHLVPSPKFSVRTLINKKAYALINKKASP